MQSGASSQTRKQQTFEQFISIHYRSLQVLLTRYSPLTTWLMRNKLVHKKAKNLSKSKNRKPGRLKLEDGLLMQIEKQNRLPDMSYPMKRAQHKLCKQFSLHGLQKLRCLLFWRSQIFPINCSLQSLLNSHALLSLRNASKAKDNCTILQIIRKETLSSSLPCAVLSFSHECAHVRCIHIQVLASQLLCQECNAEVYLEWFC